MTGSSDESGKNMDGQKKTMARLVIGNRHGNYERECHLVALLDFRCTYMRSHHSGI